MASWLVCSTRDRAVRVRILAEDIKLGSWARYFALTVPLSTQVNKWVPANLVLVDYHPIRRMEDSCYGNRDKLWPLGPLGSNADFTFLPMWCTGGRVILKR